MKTGRRFLYARLALDGMKKNKQLVLPFLISAILMTGMFYILAFLNYSNVMADMMGGGTATEIIKLGIYVIALFAVIFLFYTYSFLIRRRKKEFGLYHILGMNKGSLSRILFLETCFSFLFVLVIGLAWGILFSKLAELGFSRIIEGGISYTFHVPMPALSLTILVFSGIFILLFINGMIQVRKTDPISLMHSENMGEKPPKANWFSGLLGIILLIAAYVIAVSIQQPIAAFIWFFIAVIMVILATYLIFIAGSVLLCKILQKNKKYYYKANHFVSVSSMSYRMKRNGAGLASICVLLTMVLVIISSSFTLYAGREECLFAKYPREQNAFACAYGYTENDREWINQMNDVVNRVVEREGIQKSNELTYHEYLIAGYLENSNLQIILNSETDMAFIDYEKVANVQFIDIEDYNKMCGKQDSLNPGEAFAYINRTKDVGENFRVGELDFHILKEVPELEKLGLDGTSATYVQPSILLIVANVDDVAKEYQDYLDVDGTPMICLRWFDDFDTGLDDQNQMRVADEIGGAIHNNGKVSLANAYCSSRIGQRKDFIQTFGGLFFLGLMLSIVFLMATVMIIYYKQISEGYEDQSRFAIMQKVGMTKKDIKKTINSQMLTVFYLPIILAALHLAFAFPMVEKLLMLFGLFNTPLYILTTAGTLIIIAIFYGVVYKMTSRAYYQIVTEMR